VCDDERDIERLGRRDVVIASRGTVTCCEWVDNFKSGLTRLPTTTGEEEAMVEGGLWRLFTAPGKAHSILQQHGRCATDCPRVQREEWHAAAEHYGDGAQPRHALVVLTAREIAMKGVWTCYALPAYARVFFYKKLS